jgi:hypothetical protein
VPVQQAHFEKLDFFDFRRAEASEPCRWWQWPSRIGFGRLFEAAGHSPTFRRYLIDIGLWLDSESWRFAIQNSTRDSGLANHLARRAPGPPSTRGSLSASAALDRNQLMPAALLKQPAAHRPPLVPVLGRLPRAQSRMAASLSFSGAALVSRVSHPSHLRIGEVRRCPAAHRRATVGSASEMAFRADAVS